MADRHMEERSTTVEGPPREGAVVRSLGTPDSAAYARHVARAIERQDAAPLGFAVLDFAGPVDRQVDARSAARRWSGRLTEPGWSRAWGAFAANGTLVGHAELWGATHHVRRHRGRVELYVSPAHRRRRLGVALLNDALRWTALRTHLAWLDMLLLADNGAGRATAQRLGFRCVASVTDWARVAGAELGLLHMSCELDLLRSSST